MFNKIPNILYDVGLSKRPVLAKNIFRYAHAIDSYRNNANFYFYHTIKSDETIEDLAEKYYDNASLSWVILLYNEIRDIYSELPRDNNTFARYIQSKYFPTDVLNFKRVKSLPRVPFRGKYDGELIYAEDTNRSLQWSSTSTAWNDVGMGVPKANSETYQVQPNTLVDADSWMISSNRLIRTKNPQLTLDRGTIYTFNIFGAHNQSFYITTDGEVNSDGSLKNWKENYQYGKYSEGISDAPLLDNTGKQIGQKFTFHIPKNAPTRLYYNSTSNPSMRGVINTKDMKINSFFQTNDTNSLQRSNGRVMGKIAKVGDDLFYWNGKYFENNVDNFTSGWDLLPKDFRTLTAAISRNTPHKFFHTIDKYEISIQTYSLMHPDNRTAYTMQSKYEYEEEMNEKNRKIKIMKPQLLENFLKDWEKVIR